MEVTYDKHGRMNYHPDFHPNHRKPWTTKDQKFLIDKYEKLGPDQVALSLGRTIRTIMQTANRLRKQGLMPKRSTKKFFPRNGRGL